MKNHWTLAMAIMALWAGSIAEAKYSGGTGEPNDPYQIATPEDLNDIGNHEDDWDKHFILVNDVNLAGRTYTTAVIAPDIDRGYPFHGMPFSGVFDGNNHKIIGLTIDGGAGNAYLGLFGYIIDGQVKNLRLEDGSIRGGYLVGGLVGDNKGSISNCYSTGFVWGNNYVGGLVGVNEDKTIANCYSTGDVSSNGCVGGLVGENFGGYISNCYSTGDVSGGDYVGGLVGDNDGSISNCYSTGNVNGTRDSIGGLVGINMEGSISNCYSTGNVNGTYLYVGGLVGFNNYGSISNCYSAGDVNGVDDVGGIAGENDGGSSIVNSFWDTNTQTHGVTESIGLNKGTIINVSGLTTAQMQTKSTFTDAGWDFAGETVNGPNDIWRMCVDIVEYPLLSWQFIRGDFACPDGVDFVDFAVLSSAWLSKSGEPDWNPACDISNPKDNFINEFDLAVFCENWLEKR